VPSLFLSYSRQDSPFADNLLDKLEGAGFQVWIDYQSLVPAKPWLEQICQGITDAEMVLLIVSRTSMASEYASLEIETAYELKKRVILIILEAVELPEWLKTLEWVDFRKSFAKGMAELTRVLHSPVELRSPPPEKGFAAPPLIWLAFVVSVAVAAITPFTFWTLYIPYYLLPLPYRILKRDFNYFYVKIALLLLPLALSISVFLAGNPSGPNPIGFYWFLSFLACWLLTPLLFFLLRSRTMRRWGKTIASRPSFANPYHPTGEKPRSVTFTLDIAPEDRRYGNDLIKGMVKHGHRYLANDPDAEVAFLLLSRYKTTTELDPETRIVYPVLLQSTKRIDSKVERVQWIDFRRGLRNLDALAELLPEPTRIFKALGIAPVGNQIVLPPIIQVLVIYLMLVGIFTFGSWAISVFQLKSELKWSQMLWLTGSLLLLLGSLYWVTRSLLRRKGRMASRRYLIPMLLFGTGLLVLFIFNRITHPDGSHNLPPDRRGSMILVSMVVYFGGLLLIMPLVLWYWKDLRRWCPQRKSLMERFFKPTSK
jgi:hypothetical protein